MEYKLEIIENELEINNKINDEYIVVDPPLESINNKYINLKPVCYERSDR